MGSRACGARFSFKQLDGEGRSPAVGQAESQRTVEGKPGVDVVDEVSDHGHGCSLSPVAKGDSGAACGHDGAVHTAPAVLPVALLGVTVAALVSSCATPQNTAAQGIARLIQAKQPGSRAVVEAVFGESLVESGPRRTPSEMVLRPLGSPSVLTQVRIAELDNRPHSESLNTVVLRSHVVLGLNTRVCVTIAELEMRLRRRIERTRYSDLHDPSTMRVGPYEIQSDNGMARDLWLNYVHQSEARFRLDSDKPDCIHEVEIRAYTRIR